MASRREFTTEYKAEAASLVIESGRSIAEVAKSLGIHENTLGAWVKKAKECDDGTGTPLSLPERAELKKLRKDYAQAQMDIAFLKKAAAWFASENK
jgi:transposase